MLIKGSEIRIIGLAGIPDIRRGDDLVEIILAGAKETNLGILDQDILVVAQKIVSKSEGRVVSLTTVEPSAFALTLASRLGKDPRFIEAILREAKTIIKMQKGILIVETHHGLICANAGVDRSNVPGNDSVSLLPINPDNSAKQIQEGIKRRTGKNVAVIVSDTFGRPWREGLADCAIGISGLCPLLDYRSTEDSYGRPLQSTVIAVADELASAAELVMGKTNRIPVAIIRGLSYPFDADTNSKSLIRDPERDLFR